MVHIITDKKKLLNRVGRLKGQLESVEKAIGADDDCKSILMTIASMRGALMGLMGDLMESHLLLHVLEGEKKPSPRQLESAQDMIGVIRTFIK